jgi:hypothetical protein
LFRVSVYVFDESELLEALDALPIKRSASSRTMKTQPVRTRTPRMRYALDQPAGIVDEIREEHGRAARCPACRTAG